MSFAFQVVRIVLSAFLVLAATAKPSPWSVDYQKRALMFYRIAGTVSRVSGRSPDQMVIGWPCVRGYTITHPVLKSGLFFAHNCGKFLTLQTATHKTHTKIHNCHVFIDTPCHMGDFF
ncbi:hypothetical protein ACODHP_005525, partial [Escherichia coli]